MKKDRINNVSVENGVTNATKTADENGATIDLQQYADGARFVVSLGTAGDSLTSINYIEFEVEESKDDSAWTDAADADVIGSVTGNNTGTFGLQNTGETPTAYSGQYTGIYRYCRCVLSFTGVSHTNGTPISVTVDKLGYKYPPTT